MGARKPRLALSGDTAQEQQRKEPTPEDKLKAIAQAAARAVGTEQRTLVMPAPAADTPASASNQGFKAPPPKPRAPHVAPPRFDDTPAQTALHTAATARATEPASAVPPTAESPTAGGNPLAGLLGYSGDEDEDDSPQQSKPADLSAAQPGRTRDSMAGGQDSEAAENGNPQDLDAELASFLSELETSGLLKDGGSTAQPSLAAAAAGQHAGTATQAGPATSVPLPAGTAERAAHDADRSAAEGVEMEADTSQAAAQGGDGVEQRVLGEVPGAEGWCRVLDTASGRVYHWNPETNEVTWPPDEVGAVGTAASRDLVMEDTSSAAADLAKSEQEADASPGRQPEEGQAAGEERQQSPGRSTPDLVLTSAAPNGGGGDAATDNLAVRGSSPSQQQTAAAGAEGEEEEQLEGGSRQAPIPAGLLALPSADVAVEAGAVAQRCTEAAGSWLDTVPQVVRLAVEAQSLFTLLSLFSQQQAAAAQARSPTAAFCWPGFEETIRRALAALESQLPAAVDAARQVQSSLASSPGPQPQQASQQPQQQGGGDGEAALVAGGDSEAPPPLPPEPDAPQGDSPRLLQPQQQAGPAAGELPGRAAAGAGARAEAANAAGGPLVQQQDGTEQPPPLPSEDDDAMELDEDELPFPGAPAGQGAAAGGVLGLGSYGGDGSGSEEEGELTAAAPALPAQQPAPATHGGPQTAAAPPLPVGSYPYPVVSYGPFVPPPLPLPMLPPGAPLPFHPLFLPPPPVGVFPPPPFPGFAPFAPPHVAPPAPVAPLFPAAPAGTAAELVSAAAATVQPPLPEEPAPLHEKRREYSAQPQLRTPAELPHGQQAPGAPPGVTGDAAPSPAEDQQALAGRAAGGAEEDGAARKRKSEKSSAAGAKKPKAQAAAKLGKGTVSLINKWQAVQKEAQEREEAEEAAAAVEADPQARAQAEEARRAREAEEWRMQQLRAGAVGDNANFAPVVGDWRDKIKQAKPERKRKKKAKDAAVESPDLDALSEGLPGGWRAMYDKGSQRVYYGNTKTQVRGL
ncbi:hypothetical protein N2152v2_009470 [Parachlorella kessleri]